MKYESFEITDAEIQKGGPDYQENPSSITATLSTPLGSVELFEWQANGKVERQDSNISINLRKEVNALFDDETPWREIYDALQNELTLIKKSRTKKQRMLMNPYTGSVDTAENWMADMKEWGTIDGKTPAQQFSLLVDVKKDKEGNWIPSNV